MVNISFPIFPNCKITFSCSAAGMLWEGATAASSWKFFTEATVTQPLKSRHQHCSCSCHLEALIFSTRDSRRGNGTAELEILGELTSLAGNFASETDGGDVFSPKRLREWCWCWSTASFLDRRERNRMHCTMHSSRSSCTDNIEFIWDVANAVVACSTVGDAWFVRNLLLCQLRSWIDSSLGGWLS